MRFLTWNAPEGDNLITGKQRSYLRALAHSYDCIFQIGKGGITEEIENQLSSALEARELIKVKALENSGYSARECADILSSDLHAEAVGVSGRTFILYRESEKKKRIELP